jgi:hypothetical protein
MKAFATRGLLLAALGAAVVAFSGGSPVGANAAADDVTIKIVMEKVNKSGVCKGLGDGLKAKEPKWDELATKSKEVVPLAKAMVKNKPPKGEDASWKKFAEDYAKAAEDLDKAIAAKDVPAALAAHKVLANCNGCHKAHK